jgi:hypothetical protein
VPEKAGRPCLRLLVSLTNYGVWPASPFVWRFSSFKHFADLRFGIKILSAGMSDKYWLAAQTIGALLTPMALMALVLGL